MDGEFVTKRRFTFRSIAMAGLQVKVSKDVLMERINLAKRLRTLNMFIEELFDFQTSDVKAEKISGFLLFIIFFCFQVGFIFIRQTFCETSCSKRLLQFARDQDDMWFTDACKLRGSIHGDSCGPFIGCWSLLHRKNEFG